jgi:parallel beta-helix repeat protein
MREKSGNDVLRNVLICLALFLLVAPAMAATTQVQVIKYANDNTTILNQTTVNYTWMMANLPVLGDGTTHYYAQGPLFLDDATNETHEQELRWNPAEDFNVLEKDMGAVKGTNLKDLTDLVGGMSPGERLKILSSDGWNKWFAYKNVYDYSIREGPIGICWYKDGKYPDSGYSEGMRMVWFADDSVNTLGPGGTGVHAFGNFDWHEAAAPEYWYYYQSGGENYPTTTGISGQYVNRIYIYSNEAPPTTPVAAFSADPVSGPAPLTVHFTDASSGTPTSWAWDFNNDNTIDSTEQSPSFIYTAAGTFTVNLTVTNSKGSDSELKTDYITVTETPAVPEAAFSANVTSGVAPLAVKFTDESTNSPTSWAWDFNGDGGIDSILQNPEILFADPGTYPVNLTVTNAGGSDFELKTNYIAVTAAPVVDTLFDGTVTLAPNTKFTLVPYNNPGASYQVNSTTPLGALDSVNKSLGIRVDVTDKSYSSKNILMVDNIGTYMYSKVSGITHTWICQVNGVTLDDFGANATDGLNIKSLANGDQVNFYYGMKPVTPGNATAVVKMTVNIPAPAAPVAAFTSDVQTGTAPLTVQFTDQSTGDGITDWAWDFTNDGTVDSAEPSPSHIYDTAGTYTVNLTVTNAGGNDSEVKTDYITVTAAGPKTWYVDDSGGADFTTIQEAVAAASAGDTIIVRDGTYNENVIIDKYITPGSSGSGAHDRTGLTLRSENGRDAVTINSLSASSAVFDLRTPGVTIDGFTIHQIGEGGSASAPRGIYASANANYGSYTIINNALDNVGYGIDLEGYIGFDNVSNNLVSTGNYTTVAYGIYIMNNGNNTLTNNAYIDSYHLSVSRGIFLYKKATVTSLCQNNIITGNTIDGAAYGLYLWSTAANQISNNTLTNDKYGLYLKGTSAVPTTGNVFYTNNIINSTVANTFYDAYCTGNTWNSPKAETYWYNGNQFTSLVGNFWSNYTSADADNNGIIDTSYLTRTSPDEFDNYPLMGAWNNGEITYTPPTVISPVAAFTSDVQTGTAPLTVQFTDQSTGDGITDWAWDFTNDGTVDSTGPSPSHIYDTAGTYSVNLTVTNAGGNDSEVKTDYITVSFPAPALLWGPYLTGTTSTGTVVNAKTNIATAVTVEYATDTYYTANSAYDQSATDSVTDTLHHVSLAGLTPDTLYHYRVVYSGQPTADLHFSTFPASGAFTFVVYSDTQDQLPTYSQLERHKLVADRIAEEPDVAFVLNSGDLVNDAANLSDWDRYFAAGSMMMANTTVYPALGNHDDNNANYYQNYGVPEYYSFDCGDGHVAVLDSNDWADYQVEGTWLANDLQTDKPFKFTTFHHPLYTSETNHFGGWTNLKEAWEGDLNDNGVLAVFNGHVHAYERLFFNDTNYFVAGIGGAPSYNLATPRYTASQNSLEYMIGYIKVTVDPAARTATAQVIRVADVSTDLKTLTNVYPAGTVFETVVMSLPELPVANFTATPLTGTAPLAVQFTDSSTGTPTAWAWDFDNDGITDNTTQSPSYTYSTAGTYTVNLTVTNAKGSDSEVKTGYISVSATPAIPELFNGTVTLTPGETFTKQAYNSGTTYTVNRTTPLGALDVAASTAGFTYDVTDSRWTYDTVLMLDNVDGYLYNKSQKWNWLAYVNDVYKDGYGNHANGLDVINLSNGDRVEFYYVRGTVDKTNLTAVKAVALATVKTVADIPSGPTYDVLFDSTVILTPNTTFTKNAYNSGTIYTVNRTTPLGALDVAASTGGFTYDVTDSRWSYDTVLMLDNVDGYLYNKSQKWNWLAYVNDVYKDGYGNHANGLNVIELADGDRVEFYYVRGSVDKTNLTAVKAVTLAAVKTVVNIAGSPPSTPDWTLSLSGAKTASVTKTFFEQGLACPSSGHMVNWTDTDGNIWSGVPLWLLVGMVDDNPDVGPDHYNFNDSIAAQGYSVKVSSGDGWDTTLASADIARNNNYIVANTLNGQPLPVNLTSGKLSWPLHLKGAAVFGGQQVGNITKIELTGLPQPPAGWTLTLEGDVTDVITQSYFEEAIASHHNVTWTDTSGNTWEGMSLWDLAGAVDDIETTSHYTFNDTRAAMGYTIRVSAGDGFNATFASADVAHNDGFFVAHKMNGAALTGSAAPLKLVGPSIVGGSQSVGNVVKISLEGLPDQYPAGDWQLTLNGKISDVIPQGEFEYWASHHSATYTDTTGNVYTGIPLWRLMGWVDDQIPHGSNGFNDAAATAGYTVIVKAGDGYAKEFTSQQIGKTDAFIVANTMNGSSLPTAGDHPPYPLRLVGSGATGGNSVGNIVEIQLTDFQTPVEAPKLHIVKYGSDGTTIINETTIDYHYMEDNLQVIGDGVTHYQYQGVTFDPTDLWDPTETKGMNPPKIDNAIKGTKVKDLVELVGGMGTGTDIIFVASDGYETVMGYSNIYTNPYVQSHQGDAVLAWYADGQYVPQYADGMRFMFTPDDHVFGQWNMHEAMDEKYWHYYWSDGIQYPSGAGSSAKYVTEIKVYSSPESDWQLELDGSDIGGISTSISKTYLEQALACQFGSEHKATYTDTKGNVWEGMPLWFFAGFVDDADQHSNNAFNDSLATGGYRVVITAGDGYNTTIDSTLIGRNSNYIVANSLNGSHIAETDSNWPLRLTGVNVTGSSAVKNITSIRLLKSLQTPTAAFIADPVSGDAPLMVQFTDQSTGTGPLTYAWDFDDDGIADNTTQSPSYTYETAGTYSVNLTVTDVAGSDSELKTDYITVNPAPVIDEWSITLSGVGSEQLTRVNFESLADGNRLTYTDASGTWSGIALWRILARVDDTDPATFSDSVADLGYTITVTASDGYSKAFTSSSLKRNDNFIVADSLNGAPLPKLDGTKKVWPLKIVGSAPTSGQKVGNITEIVLSDFVTPPEAPLAGFKAVPLSGTAPLTVQFTDQSTGTGPLTYAWDFDNDGTTDNTTQSPSYTYATAGTYTVNLTVTGTGGSDSEIKTDYITVSSAVTLLPLPGQVNAPTDPDGDGLYEDIGGDGEAGYADVVLFFKNIEWITENEPAGAFDFSGNGAIGFQDIVDLFKEV